MSAKHETAAFNVADSMEASSSASNAVSTTIPEGDTVVVKRASHFKPSPAPPMCEFSDLCLDPWLISALHAMAIRQPTEIQRACIRPILEAEQFNVLGKAINLKVSVVVGGLALELAKRPHVIIATPGRLADHILSSSNAIHFQRIKYLVLDEADRLLSPTFASDLSVIMEKIPRKRQTLLFTATMTDSILALKDKKPDPSRGQNALPPLVHICDTSGGVITVSTLTQNYIFVPSHVKEAYLVNLIRSDEHNDKSMIIFVGTCKAAESLRVLLREMGFRVTALHSKMSQQERLNSLGKFRAEAVKTLIATDVASRGLDIPTVGLVINLHVPRDPDDYIHRVGRTARAGRGGRAVTIMSEADIKLIHNVEAKVGKQLEEYPVNEKEVLEILSKVVAAKRVAAMHLLETNFGEKDRIREMKRKNDPAMDDKARRPGKRQRANKRKA
ncbi:putative RNA helicase [Spiromyces aspiralis]|uniref:RNA helicase n=1 Tax=Spiromyces aspiralis TaxID=68401 RepID=A0ACC1HZ95_9FUNG|nr:putative RNA helicase [Spiromyces aspiralis]